LAAFESVNEFVLNYYEKLFEAHWQFGDRQEEQKTSKIRWHWFTRTEMEGSQRVSRLQDAWIAFYVAAKIVGKQRKTTGEKEPTLITWWKFVSLVI